MKFIYRLLFILLLGSGFACEDPQNTEEPSPALSPKNSIEARQRSAPPKRNTSIGVDYCSIQNRIEFDVYDADPEFTNPKNYELRLFLNSQLIGSRSFDQNCTFNNTVDFWNLEAGSYSYVLTSTCAGQTYTGNIQYQGGYYGIGLYIEQSACD